MLQIIKDQIIKGRHGRDFLSDVFFLKNGQLKPIVIFAHGFKGFKDWGPYDLVATRFAEAGFVFVKFSFSHNGTTLSAPTEFADLEAFGQNNFSIELDDLNCVVNAVTNCSFRIDGFNTEADVKDISLIGHSRGGGIVMLQAAEDKRIKRVVTWASVNEFGKFWPKGEMERIKAAGVIYIPNARTNQQMPIYWQMYEDYLAHMDRLHIPSRFKALNIPSLIVHGTKDETVPFSAAEELKSWNANATLFTIENANHNFGGKHPWLTGELPNDLKLVVAETIRFFKA